MGLTFVALAISIGTFVTSRDGVEKRGGKSEDDFRAKLVDQIYFEARGDSRHVKVVPAPIPVEFDQHDLTVRDLQSEHVLRNGYSVVSVSPEMTQIAMAESSEPNQSQPNKPWLRSDQAVEVLLEQTKAAGRSWTFGWLQLAHPVASTVVSSSVEDYSGRVLGSSGKFIRVELPNDREKLEGIAALPWVSGLGAVPPNYKISSEFLREIDEANPSDAVPVFITSMSNDPDDRWRHELERLGVVVGRFDPTIRVYDVIVTYGSVLELLKQDFILSIEPIGIVTSTHDTAVPAMGADALRQVGNSAGTYTGIRGHTVPVGVMDTGLNTNHVAISSLRQSICGANFVEGEAHDLWVDEGMHGTHVTGTVAGNGFNQPRYAGMAPGVEHIRFAKVLSRFGFGFFTDIHSGMDFLAKATSCPDAGWTDDEVKPLIVNMSLSGTSLRWEGRSAGPRKLDSIVWGHRQLYVVANSNDSIHGYSNYASAKNSLAVGAARDSGDLAGFSSLGPTADGRLAPQIVGTGVDLYSTAGNHSREEYQSFSGTSMASPSVAGVAALLMDASPDHRESPALARARLLASAIKPDSWFDSSDGFPRNNSDGPGSIQAQFGLGMVSARTSVLNRDTPEGWVSGSATTEITDGEYAYTDIDVPQGASRLDIVMTWDEPPTDTISRAVLNDLNLWIDHGADCGTEACGEYASKSTIDNVEWVVVSNPDPGTYRVKVVPEAIYTEAPRAAVAWTVVRGDSAPDLSIETDLKIYRSSEFNHHQIELIVSSSSYVSTGTRVHFDCRTMEGDTCGVFASSNELVFTHWQHEGFVSREDGIGFDSEAAAYIPVGEVAEGEQQRLEVILWAIDKRDEPVRIFITATSWNGESGSTSVLFERTGSTDEATDEPTTPINDDFASSLVVIGGEGQREVDTLLATTENGEPILGSSGERPSGSVWFTWVAEESSLAGFSVNPLAVTGGDYATEHAPDLDVFFGDHIASLQPIASSSWSAQFFAEEDKTYRVRVSHSNSSMPLVLNWFTGARPSNDDFAQAIVIEGESGSESGTNLGATLESGERFGQFAATVWWRWTAPRDGVWRFRIEDAHIVHVLGFTGRQVDELRLMSGIRSLEESDQGVKFPVREGNEYYICVASPDAFEGGAKFNALSWSEFDGSSGTGDMFDDAQILEGTDEGSTNLYADASSGVEPSEPMESGIRTVWWLWEAPSTGRYTWFWTGKGVRVAAFTGTTLEELTFVSGGGQGLYSKEFVLDANEGETYWLSFGYPKDEDRAFSSNRSGFETDLQWGITPPNDSLADAEQLLGLSGSTSGSTWFGTTESDGRTHLGYGSLWYTIEPDEPGWYRVWIEDESLPLIISVFRRGDESQSLSLIMASRSQRLTGEGTEVIFQAESGTEYFVRVGSTSPHQSTQFTMRWEQTSSPKWLRYVGRVADGWRDAAGNIVALQTPRELAFESTGKELYAASASGLTVFERNSENGLLTVLEQHDEVPSSSYLAWDPHRTRLYANDGCSWWTYKRDDEPRIKRLDDAVEGCYTGSSPVIGCCSWTPMATTCTEWQLTHTLSSDSAETDNWSTWEVSSIPIPFNLSITLRILEVTCTEGVGVNYIHTNAGLAVVSLIVSPVRFLCIALGLSTRSPMKPYLPLIETLTLMQQSPCMTQLMSSRV